MSTSVLIVDDERGIRESLTGLLEDEGFGVEVGGTGEACLPFSSKGHFVACCSTCVSAPGSTASKCSND